MKILEFLEQRIQPKYVGWKDQYKAIFYALGIDPDEDHISVISRTNIQTKEFVESHEQLSPHKYEIVLASEDEVYVVLSRMRDILEKYNVVSVADLHDLCGLPTVYTDNKWGWSKLDSTIGIKQVKQGYVIEFPPAEKI